MRTDAESTCSFRANMIWQSTSSNGTSISEVQTKCKLHIYFHAAPTHSTFDTGRKVMNFEHWPEAGKLSGGNICKWLGAVWLGLRTICHESSWYTSGTLHRKWDNGVGRIYYVHFCIYCSVNVFPKVTVRFSQHTKYCRT